MATKAIKVTNANREELNSRFYKDGEATGIPIAVGYFLVLLFGSDDSNYEVLSPARFNEKFTIGEPLHNAGWFEAIRKE